MCGAFVEEVKTVAAVAEAEVAGVESVVVLVEVVQHVKTLTFMMCGVLYHFRVSNMMKTHLFVIYQTQPIET